MRDKEQGDPFFMVQIISSAIINVPPPQALLTVLNQNSKYNTFNGNVEEKMYKIFTKSPNGNVVRSIIDKKKERVMELLLICRMGKSGRIAK